MILTRDNLLRYVREQKAVTPTMVSEIFDTSTMIASAALSELAKEKLIAITQLKLASSPYYYDLKQREVLIELAEKHFSKYDKDIFHKLKQQQVVNHNSLSIQEGLAVERIRDFAIPLEINHSGKDLKFWVWYLRDLNETKTQIMQAIKGTQSPNTQSKQQQQSQQQERPKVQETIVQEIKKELAPNIQSQQSGQRMQQQTNQQQVQQRVQSQQTSQQQTLTTPRFNTQSVQEEQRNKEEMFIENYFRHNYLNIETKNKSDKSIEYDLSININNIKILFDSIYYYKKPNETDIMKFYTSSLKPKIIFVQNAPKKLLKMSETLENLTIINI